jgi:hypothetical protein
MYSTEGAPSQHLPARGTPQDVGWGTLLDDARRLAAGQLDHQRSLLRQTEAWRLEAHPPRERLRFLLQAIVFDQRSRADAMAAGVAAPGDVFYAQCLRERQERRR